MANLSSLKRSITEVSVEEGLALVLKVRASRRTAKKPASVAKKKASEGAGLKRETLKDAAELLRLKGKKQKDIAKELNVSDRTIRAWNRERRLRDGGEGRPEAEI